MKRIAILAGCLILFCLGSGTSFALEYGIPNLSGAQLLRAYEVIRGDQSGNLMEDMPINRQQIAVILARLHRQESDAAEYKPLPGFADDFMIDKWALPYVSYARKMGWMKGDPFGVFDPKGFLGSEHLAVLINRLVDGEEKPWGQNVAHLNARLGMSMPTAEMMTRGEIFEVLWQAVSTENEGGTSFLERQGFPVLPDAAGKTDEVIMPDRFAEAMRNVHWLDGRYDHFIGFSEGLAVCDAVDGNQSYKAYLDEGGAEVLRLEAAEARNFSGGLAVVGVEKENVVKYGYMDRNGAFVIDPVFDEAFDFSGGFAVVGVRNESGETEYGLLKKDGSYFVAPGKYARLQSFSEGFAPAMISENRWILIDDRGAAALGGREFEYIEPFSQGLALFVENGKYGYINAEGVTMIPAARDYIPLPVSFPGSFSFANGRAMILEKTQTGFVVGFVDMSGEVVVPPKYEEAWMYGGGYVTVSADASSGEYMLMDRSGAIVMKDRIEVLTRIYNRFALIKKDGVWGIIYIKKP